MKIFYNTILLPLLLVFLQVWLVHSAPVHERRTSTKMYKHIYIPETFFFKKPQNWGKTLYAYIYSDDPEVNNDALYQTYLGEWPGKKLVYDGAKDPKDTWYHGDAALGMHRNTTYIIFNDGDGGHQYPERMEKGIVLDAICQVYSVDGILGALRYLSDQYQKNNVVYYVKAVHVMYQPRIEHPETVEEEEQDLYIHYQVGGRPWTEVPGDKMRVVHGDDGRVFYEKYINLYENEEDLRFAFTNGRGVWDNHGEKNYHYQVRTVAETEIWVESDIQFY